MHDHSGSNDLKASVFCAGREVLDSAQEELFPLLPSTKATPKLLKGINEWYPTVDTIVCEDIGTAVIQKSVRSNACVPKGNTMAGEHPAILVLLISDSCQPLRP